MSPSPHHQRGVSFVLWLIALFPLLGFATLAVDVNNIFLVRAQVQNAADAGALAGVVKLPDAAAARTAAIAVARANQAQGTAVETDEDEGDVTVGCWSFSTTGGGFTTTNCGTTANPFNAVEVITRRRDTPIQAFFGKAVGFDKYSAEAIARAYARPAENPVATNNRWVLCGPGAFVPNWPTNNSTCRKLISAGNNTDCGGSYSCTIKSLSNQTPIPIRIGGDPVELKPGNVNANDLGDLQNVNGEELLAVVESCPNQNHVFRQVLKIVKAKTQLITDGKPCVIFPDIGAGGEPNNANGPARLVY